MNKKNFINYYNLMFWRAIIFLVVAASVIIHIWLSSGTLNYDEIGMFSIISDSDFKSLFTNTWWRNHFIGTAGAKFMYMIAGKNETLLRIPSNLFFIGSAIFLLLISRLYLQPLSQLVLLILFCFNPLWLSLSASFRGYVSFVCLFLALFYFCIRICEKKEPLRFWNSIILFLISVCLSLTHLFGAFSAAAIGISVFLQGYLSKWRYGEDKHLSRSVEMAICILLGVLIASPFYLFYLKSIVWYGENVSGEMPTFFVAGKMLAGLYGALIINWSRSFIGGPIYAILFGTVTWSLLKEPKKMLHWGNLTILSMYIFVFLVLRPREMHTRFLIILLPISLIILIYALDRLQYPRNWIIIGLCLILISGQWMSDILNLRPYQFPRSELNNARTHIGENIRFVLFPNYASGQFVFRYYMTPKEQQNKTEFDSETITPEIRVHLQKIEQSRERNFYAFPVYNFDHPSTPADWKEYLLKHCVPFQETCRIIWIYKNK